MAQLDVKKAGVFIDAELIAEAMEQAKALGPGKHTLFEKELFKQKVIPGTILADVAVWNDAELHFHEADLWICLSGTAKFIYGGEMKDSWQKAGNDTEMFAKEITGGTEAVLKAGDILFIPANEPHQHGAEKIAVLAVVKIPKATS